MSVTEALPDAMREQLALALDWHDAHVSFDDAVKGLTTTARGKRAAGFPHTPWELVEHMRRAQHDLLDFCINPAYMTPSWPDDYWPSETAPSSAAAWTQSLAAFRRDREALQQLVRDRSRALGAAIPHGSGQTYLHEILLAIDHAAYHIGQLVAVRRALNEWRDR
jgi:hypothetical protein